MKKDHPPDSNISKYRSALYNTMCPKEKKQESDSEDATLKLLKMMLERNEVEIKPRSSYFGKSLRGNYSYAHLNYALKPSSKYILRLSLKNTKRLCDIGVGII